jgi:hypothetical protein
MAGEPILVTGAAGFIGFALREGSSRMAARLLASTMSIPIMIRQRRGPPSIGNLRISPFIGLISPIESWSSTSAEGGQSALISRANS